MTTGTVQQLEPLAPWRRRVVDLNRLYNPDDPVNDGVLMASDDWHAGPQDDRAARARKALAQIHRTFPYGAPLWEQAAYLVRGFLGLSPFAEANHRTGWDYAAELIHHQGHDLIGSVDDCRAIGMELWRIMEETYPDGFTADRLLEEDEVWHFLCDRLKRRIA